MSIKPNSLTSLVMNKTASEAVDILARAYVKSQNSKLLNEKKGYDALKSSLIGAGIGAGVGGLGTLGMNALRGEDFNARDALYGAFLGSIPGAGVGYMLRDPEVPPPEGVNKAIPVKGKDDTKDDTKKKPTVPTSTGTRGVGDALHLGGEAILGAAGGRIVAPLLTPGTSRNAANIDKASKSDAKLTAWHAANRKPSGAATSPAVKAYNAKLAIEQATHDRSNKTITDTTSAGIGTNPTAKVTGKINSITRAAAMLPFVMRNLGGATDNALDFFGGAGSSGRTPEATAAAAVPNPYTDMAAPTVEKLLKLIGQ